ncbi:hypothetical protein BY457_107148 [Marinilabilia salmonicolor]|jgi:hypothetical protein|uniref:hypothetical protein n=1 Tax=Marinilabilia salmonicolor TaxID=989 RepID=UPI000D07E6FF|nr:hypothetical protein [Marinilabilia salmonicolor]PRZ00086.1 hypothetical protein BY457_107148 [Marinilabilia salmonicolor]
MKKLFLALFISIPMVAAAQSNTETITTFLEGIINFQEVEVNDHNPIISIGELAAQQADTTIVLTGENVSETFDKAMNYNHSLIVVGIHTAVLVSSWEDCTPSGAWDACMPMGEGFVKRTALEKETGYINNIIGIPDNQERKVYLFN